MSAIGGLRLHACALLLLLIDAALKVLLPILHMHACPHAYANNQTQRLGSVVMWWWA